MSYLVEPKCLGGCILGTSSLAAAAAAAVSSRDKGALPACSSAPPKHVRFSLRVFRRALSPKLKPAVAEGGASGGRVDVRVLPAAHLLHVVRQVRLRLQHEGRATTAYLGLELSCRTLSKIVIVFGFYGFVRARWPLMVHD